MIKIDLHIKKTHGHYVVYNTEKDKAHTHIRSAKTARKLISLLERGILPDSPFLIESARRLLTIDEFMKLKEHKKKQHYINIGVKGCRSHA